MKHSKKLVLLAAAAVMAVAAVGAYAYWTTSGSGEGSATAASENGTLVLDALIDEGIYPGGSVPVSFTADSGSDSKLYVNTIHLVSVEAPAGCDVADFTMDDVLSETIVEPHASGQDLDGQGELVFANSDENQDACKSGQITLNISST